MFSGDLTSVELHETRRAIKAALPGSARVLGKIASEMRKLSGAGPAKGGGRGEAESVAELDLFRVAETTRKVSPAKELAIDMGKSATAQVLPALPDSFLGLVETAMKAAEKWLALNNPSDFRESLLSLYFRLVTFTRVAEAYDERYVTLCLPGDQGRVELFCLDPSARLREALQRGKAAIFFSATLTPIQYYVALLGGEREDQVFQVSSPFPPENFPVLVQDRVPTHFKARAGSLTQVAEAIAAVIFGRQGNYLVYFPSYQYLRDVLDHFQKQHPAVRARVQRPGMSEAEREEFLKAFAADHTETLVGFAVLGGIFGEGIDLAGERLVGAIIVGVGLPQLCLERDLIRAYFDEKSLPGFDYAYTFPGMNRVLQAVGRVIRSEKDRGVALLVDTRFGQARYRGLFPAWWQAQRVRNLEEIRQSVRQFWASA